MTVLIIPHISCVSHTFKGPLCCFPGQHFSLRQLGICEPPPPRRGLAFCSDVGLPHRGFSVGTAPDVDADGQAVMSPERAMRLWGRGGVAKTSGRSSCLSSRSNSVLTLTDTEHENKSDSDNGRTTSLPVSALVFSFFFSFPRIESKPKICWQSLCRTHVDLL